MLAGSFSQQPPRPRWGRVFCNFPTSANLAPRPRFTSLLASRLGSSVQVHTYAISNLNEASLEYVGNH